MNRTERTQFVETGAMTPDNRERDLYPEITASGSLLACLSEALRAVDPRLKCRDSGDNWFPGAYARVENAHRFTQVNIAAEKRLFMPSFWSHGVCLAHGKCSDLAETARAVAVWNGDLGSTTKTLAAAYPWVVPTESAEPHESGNAVEWKWARMLQDAECSAETHAAIVRASQEPALRQLFPYTSLWSLCFSRCTGYPFTMDTLRIWPAEGGQYRAETTDEDTIATGDLETIIRVVVENLPYDCGPAWQGTAEDEEKM